MKKHIFSEELYIAYATCENCNNREFIVSGQTQFCNHCGELLFRNEEKLYTLKKEETNNMIKDIFVKDKLSFPQEIIIGHAICNNASNEEEVVVKDIVICQECKERMTIDDTAKYFLSNNNSKCEV